MCRAFTRLPVPTSLVRGSRLVNCVLVATPECRSSHWAQRSPSVDRTFMCGSPCELADVPVKGQWLATCSRRRVDSTRARTSTSGAERSAGGQTVISSTQVKLPLLFVMFSVQDNKTVKVVSCENSVRPHTLKLEVFKVSRGSKVPFRGRGLHGERGRIDFWRAPRQLQNDIRLGEFGC